MYFVLNYIFVSSILFLLLNCGSLIEELKFNHNVNIKFIVILFGIKAKYIFFLMIIRYEGPIKERERDVFS